MGWILLLVILSVLIGLWAVAWERSFGWWFLGSLILSPVIMGIALLIAGRNVADSKPPGMKGSMFK